MKLGVLFSGGKDSALAAWIVEKEGHEILCLITIDSENKESFMFHTPNISKVEVQAEKMGLPLLVVKTKGEKEKELIDLKEAILEAKEKYGIEGIVTGAIESVYQSSRIQKICDEVKIKCLNPLWQKDQLEILENIVSTGFKVIIVGVFAYPLDNRLLGREIDKNFIKEVKKLKNKYKISPAGEGGEFESFVLWSPMFDSEIKIKGFEDFGENHSWRRELVL